MKFDVTQLTPAQETVYNGVLNHPNGVTAKELGEKLNLEMSGVSKHLSAIYQLGGLERRIEKQSIIYTVKGAEAAPAKAAAKKAPAAKKEKTEKTKPEKKAATKEVKVKDKKEKETPKEKAKDTKSNKPKEKADVVSAEGEVTAPPKKTINSELRGKRPVRDKAKKTPELKYIKVDGSLNFNKVSAFKRGDVVEVTNRFDKNKEVAMVLQHYWEFWQGKFYTRVLYFRDNAVHLVMTDKIVGEAKAPKGAKVEELLAAHAELKTANWKTEMFLKALAKGQ